MDNAFRALLGLLRERSAVLRETSPCGRHESRARWRAGRGPCRL